MSLFSYPSTYQAYESPKVARVTVADDFEGATPVQFVLERGSRAIKPGKSIDLSGYEMSQVDPGHFDSGRLTKVDLDESGEPVDPGDGDDPDPDPGDGDGDGDGGGDG